MKKPKFRVTKKYIAEIVKRANDMKTGKVKVIRFTGTVEELRRDFFKLFPVKRRRKK